MINRELYFRDPTTIELLNNGVSKVSEIGHDERQIKTLRFELETFVCDGEYARGLERILKAYLDELGRGEQKAVWVSGFFGSGKSHLVKVLRYLWEDYRFDDGATARSIVKLPTEIADLLKELSTRSKPLGGLRAAAGTLGAGSMDNVRLAFIQLVLRAAGLPENLAQAKFVLWLRSSGLEAKVSDVLKRQKRELSREVLSLKLSVPLAEALVAADSKYATAANAQAAIRAEFPDITAPTMAQALDFVEQVFGDNGKFPCTLLVVDEIQQFIGEKIQRAMDMQEIAEHCCTKLNQRLLLVGTGQSALNTTPSLQRLQARFAVRVQLSDADVESVIRKTVLRKKPEHEPVISDCLNSNQGEVARHLQNTRFAATHDDDKFFVADYPLLPTRRRFWEKVLRNTDHSGTKAQLRSQLQIVFEATRQTAASSVGTVVPADFIYDQISTDLLNSGELEREYNEIIRKQRDGTKDGDLRSSLCALVFLIGKLPRTPGADDGVRATAETLVDLLVSDLKSDRTKLEQEVPKLLKQLVDAGQLMPVEAEYRLQTREGARWTHDFNRRRTATLNDDERINSKRAELLRDGVKQALRPVSLQQGTSRQPRKLAFELSSSRPSSSNDEVTLWVRDGWNDDEKSVLNDARAAGVDSPLLFGYLPRLHHEELRQAIASHVAAQETLDAHGLAATPEAIEARKAVETHLEVARHRVQELLGHVIGGAKVFLGGGQEANGIELADKVQDSAASALERLFPRFSEADHGNWGQVVNRARAGDVGALSQVGHPGDLTKHAVCRRVLDLESAGGSAPRPESPDVQGVRALQMLSGNVQLLKIHEQKGDLAGKLAAWKKNADGIAKRWPAWERLLDFQSFSEGAAEGEACAKSIAAITSGRALLADPDPTPELTKQLTAALRTAVGKLQADVAAAFKAGDEKLAASQIWGRLSDEQRSSLAGTCQLNPPAKEAIGTDDEVLAALRTSTLRDRRNLLDAVPQRFARALDEASRLLEPKAQRVSLPGGTIHNIAELDEWLAGVREHVEEKLKDGPVIL